MSIAVRPNELNSEIKRLQGSNAKQPFLSGNDSCINLSYRLSKNNKN